MRNINKKVREVYKKYGLDGPPSTEQLVDILKKLGYAVQPYKSKDIEYFGEQIPPAYTLDSKKKVVLYNGGLSEQDLIITFTHELGHIVLNHLRGCDDPQDTSVYKDYEANLFTHKLLTYKRTSKIRIIAFIVSLIICFSNLAYSSLLMHQVKNQSTNQEVTTHINNQESPAIFQQNYIITSTGKKYHYPNCHYVKYKSNTIKITKHEAISLGKEPCSVCIGR